MIFEPVVQNHQKKHYANAQNGHRVAPKGAAPKRHPSLILWEFRSLLLGSGIAKRREACEKERCNREQIP
jgi:hypothetical protein